MLPFSGGSDSAATALTVYHIGTLVRRQAEMGGGGVVERMGWAGMSLKEICGKLMHTVYLGSRYSSRETRERAAKLA
jgi:NAD+ synthase (glutamine-hydrolysing)